MTSLPERKMDNDNAAEERAPEQIVKHSVSIAGHRTSVSLESKFWELLQLSAQRRGLSLNELVSEIDRTRQGNLSSAIRLYVLHELIGKSRD